MQAFISKIISIIMAILAFLGLVKPTEGIDIGAGVKAGISERTIAIMLNANETTGYSWQYDTDSDCIIFSGKNYSSQGNLLGSGGVNTFNFTAVKAGSVSITFEYLRTFEENSTADKITVTFDVTEALIFENVKAFRIEQ